MLTLEFKKKNYYKNVLFIFENMQLDKIHIILNMKFNYESYLQEFL